MRCPYCNSPDSQVKDSRPDADDNSIRRRRICEKCGAKFTTVERVQLRDLKVRKRDGSVEPFDRNKIKKSIQVACQKRNIPEARIETITSSLHRQLETVSEDIISSEIIGNMVSESLLVLDPIAFIRFVSVYRKFSKISEFKKIISEIPELDEGGQNVQSSKKFANGKLF
jgi:transcriptional repressor NrdR